MAVASTFIIVIGMPVMAPTHPSAKWVFTEFQNTTGYDNGGLVFFFGLLQAGWVLVIIFFRFVSSKPLTNVYFKSSVTRTVHIFPKAPKTLKLLAHVVSSFLSLPLLYSAFFFASPHCFLSKTSKKFRIQASQLEHFSFAPPTNLSPPSF